MSRFSRRDESPNIARSALLTIVFLSMVPFNIILRSFTLKVLWGWFVQPLGLPVLGYAHATGLVTTIGLFMLSWSLPKNTDFREDTAETTELMKTDEGALSILVRSIATALTVNACFLGFGAFYHHLM